MCKKGFTLAEVLVTLAIVGVLASMTIPTLLQNLNDAQYKTAWKKAYADLQQATYSILNEEGSFSGMCASGATEDTCFANKFLTKLNVIKSCASTTLLEVAGENCWYSTTKFLNGTEWSSANPTMYPGAILNNGYLIIFDVESVNCNRATGSQNRCGYIIVDINGKKAPNTVGKDVYGLEMLSDRIIPFGAMNDEAPPSTNCVEGSTDTSNYGFGCSAKYLYQ